MISRAEIPSVARPRDPHRVAKRGFGLVFGRLGQPLLGDKRRFRRGGPGGGLASAQESERLPRTGCLDLDAGDTASRRGLRGQRHQPEFPARRRQPEHRTLAGRLWITGDTGHDGAGLQLGRLAQSREEGPDPKDLEQVEM